MVAKSISIEEEGKWACRSALRLDGAKKVLLTLFKMNRCVLNPLWVVAEVVVVSLMAEEHVTVAPE